MQESTDTRTAAEIAAADERAAARGGSTSQQDVPQGTLTAQDAEELAQLRAERARAASTPTAQATSTISITEDRLAQIIATAVAQGRRDAAIAGGARPEKPEELHAHTDESQAAVEGDCDHPLSAHEYFGEDGYGRCHVDGCNCTGRELGSAALRAAKAKVSSANGAGSYAGSSQSKADNATLANPLSTPADRAAAQTRRDAGARNRVAVAA